MINFNLQKWQTGEYDVFTVEGDENSTIVKEVTQLTYFEKIKNNKPCLVGVVDGFLLSWYYNNSLKEHNLKLRPKVKKIWINVYLNNNGVPFVFGGIYENKKEAKNSKWMDIPSRTYLKTIPLTNEPE